MPNCHVFNYLSLIVLRHFHLWSLPRIANHLEKQMTIHVKNSAYPPFQQSFLPINLPMRLIWFSSTGLPGLPGWLSLHLQDSQAVQCNPVFWRRLDTWQEFLPDEYGYKQFDFNKQTLKPSWVSGDSHPKISSPHHQHNQEKILIITFSITATQSCFVN